MSLEKFKKAIKSPFFIIFLLSLVSLLVAFFFVRYPLQLNGDAPSYFDAMKFMQGQPANQLTYDTQENAEFFLKVRILTTPLMLLSSILAGKLFGGEYQGMLAVNIVFYFLIILVFYRLAWIVYQDKRVAFIGTVFFLANYGLYNYGTTYRTDLGGWFFFLLASWLAVSYFYRPENKKFYFLSILASSVGVLFKEYGALGLISLIIIVLYQSAGSWQKVKAVIKIAALFLIIPVVYHLFIYWQFNFSYLDWYGYNFKEIINNPATPAINWSIFLLIKVLGWLFSVGWPIFVFGLYQEYKNFNYQRFKILLAILPASLAFLAWPALTQRIAFIFVPLLALISGYGLSKIKNRYLIGLILMIYILINYLIRNQFLPWDLLRLVNI